MSRQDFLVEYLHRCLETDNFEEIKNLLVQSINNDDAMAFYTNQQVEQVILNTVDVDDVPFDDLQIIESQDEKRSFQSFIDELRIMTEN